MRYLFVILLVVAMGIFPVMGQEMDPDCEPAAVQENFVGQLSELDTSDPDAFYTGFATVRAVMAARQAACDELVFTSEEEGLQAVIGPVFVPAGAYTAVVDTEGFFIADYELIDGSCEHSGFGSLFNLGRGDATGGAEKLFRSEECLLIIQTSNVTDPWEFRFELLLPAD